MPIDSGMASGSGMPSDSGQFVFIHDGSFSGFLCAVAEAINASRSGSQVPHLRGVGEGESLFDEPVTVPRDEKRARRLWERLMKRAGAEALRSCLEAFCSDFAGMSDPICHAFLRISREGKNALDDLTDPDLRLVEKAAVRTRAQAHLLAGLIRFSELADGSWFASIEPDCDILPLIGGHFSSRYSSMRFVIRDGRRKTAIVHVPGRPWKIVRGFNIGRHDDVARLPLSGREELLREGWVEYFSAVAIEGRKNPRLQAGRMPKKYWASLPEMKIIIPGDISSIAKRE
jgi:probable DNA metabolism protein